MQPSPTAAQGPKAAGSAARRMTFVFCAARNNARNDARNDAQNDARDDGSMTCRTRERTRDGARTCRAQRLGLGLGQGFNALATANTILL